MRTEEELRLVTDFAELRDGMIVVLPNCGKCGGRHRGMTIALGTGETLDPYGYIMEEDNWDLVPEAPCGVNCVAEGYVAERSIYRVVDGLASDATTETTRTLERVK